MQYPGMNPLPKKKVELPSVLYRKPSFTADSRSMPVFNPSSPQGNLLTGDEQGIAMRGQGAIPQGGVNTAGRLPGYAGDTSAGMDGAALDDQAALDERVRADLENNPQTASQRAMERYRRLGTDPIEDDTKGSMLYGATNSMNDAARSGSLAYTAGAALGGGVSGLINKKLLPTVQREAEKKTAAGEIKTAQEQEEYEAAIAYKKAQTEALNRGKWTYKKQGGRTLAIDPKNPTVGYAVTDEGGNPIAPDIQKPVMIDVMQPDGVNVGKATVEGGVATSVTGPDGLPVVTKRVEGVDPVTGVKSGTQAGIDARTKEGELNRLSREKVAQWNIKSREKVAATTAAIAKERVNLSKSEFNAKRPGAGRQISYADVAAEGKKLGLDEEKAAEFFADKGFALVDEYGK